METKKSLKANLEKGKSLNLLMGIVVAMGLLFVSFEWGTPDMKIEAFDRDGGIIWTDEIPITMPEPPTPPPPPPKIVVADVLTVVDDTKNVADNPHITTEDTPETPQPDTYVPVIIVQDDEDEGETPFVIVEQMPVFPGGDQELLRFVNRSIKYPVIAQENGIQGRVTCSFVINRDGSVVDAEIIRGVDPSLDKEALRVISTMPKWKPGMQRGKPVRVKYTIPITFRLQ